MSDLKTIAQLKEDLNRLLQRMERAKGARERLDEELREELGGDDLEDWKAALQKLTEREEKAMRNQEEEERAFREGPGGKLLEEGQH